MDESSWLLTLVMWVAASVKWWAIASGCLLVLLLLAGRHPLSSLDDESPTAPLSPDGKLSSGP
jgi:hypothetical protein